MLSTMSAFYSLYIGLHFMFMNHLISKLDFIKVTKTTSTRFHYHMPFKCRLSLACTCHYAQF